MLTYIVQDSDEFELKKSNWPFRDFDPTDEFDMESFAQACAKEYRDDYDGWECWRDGEKDISLYWEGQLAGKFEVLLEYEPTYAVYPKN